MNGSIETWTEILILRQLWVLCRSSSSHRGAVCSAGQPKLLNTGKFLWQKDLKKSSHGKSHFPFPGNTTYHGWGTIRRGTRNVQGAPRHTFRKASNAIPTSWTRHERLPSKEGDHIYPRLLTHAMPTTSEWLVLYFLSKHTETLSR